MKTITRKALYILFPFLSSWMVAGYFHLIQCALAWDILTGWFIVIMSFIPAFFMEFFLTKFYALKWPENRPDSVSPKKILFPYAFNMFLWLVFFVGWVVFVYKQFSLSPALKAYGPYFFSWSLILWRSMTWLSIVCLLIWAGLYYFISVKKGRLRIVVSIAPYFLFTFFLFWFQWQFGGMGGIHAGNIEEQPGVTRIYDISELEKAMAEDINPGSKMLMPPGKAYKSIREVKAVDKPRSIRVDKSGNILYLFFGGTYFLNVDYPCIVKKDLRTGKIDYLLTFSNIRQIDDDEDYIYVAPWHDDYLYVISKKDLSVKHAVHREVLQPTFQWEPFSILRKKNQPEIILSTEFYPSILLYDFEKGRLLESLDLAEKGIIREGGIAMDLLQSRKTGNVYFQTIEGNTDVVEIDPHTLEIKRTLGLDDSFGPSSLRLDDENQILYIQSGSTNPLYALDLETWKIKKIYRGELHARRLRLDPKRNVIYVLGYCSGNVSAIDLETGKKLWKVRVGGRPHGMVLQNDALWVHSMDGAFKLDLETIYEHKKQKQ